MARRSRTPTSSFVAAPVQVLAGDGERRAGGRAGRTASSPTSARSSARWSSAVDDPRFIGGHPLAGAETAGVEHARADLFADATWYLTPTPDDAGHRLRAAAPAASRGSAPGRRRSSPTPTTSSWRSVSHLPHVLANVLVAQAARVLSAEGERLPATGPSFRDVTRVAGANSAIWGGIYRANADALVAAIDDMVARLSAVRDMLAAGDDDGHRGVERRRPRGSPPPARVRPRRRRGARAARARPEPPGDRRGDRAWRSGRATIDIVDMGLYPSSGSHGTVALWIRGGVVAEQAERLVRDLGLEVARA